MFTPENLSPGTLKTIVKDKWGIEIGTGSWKLKDKTVRIGTMGWYGRDIVYKTIKMVTEIHNCSGSIAEEAYDYYTSLL
jgi:aspartate aminotransferase-like enzyme